MHLVHMIQYILRVEKQNANKQTVYVEIFSFIAFSYFVWIGNVVVQEDTWKISASHTYFGCFTYFT